MHQQEMLKGNTDTTMAFIFVAMAVTTAVFLKVGPRLLRIGLLTVATSIFVIITVASLPVSLNGLVVILMIFASLAFLLIPAMLEPTLKRQQLELETTGEAAAAWSSDDGYSSL